MSRLNMAIIGYDDIDVARTSRPALTTIKQPIDRMAAAVYELAVSGKDSAEKPAKDRFQPGDSEKGFGLKKYQGAKNGGNCCP